MKKARPHGTTPEFFSRRSAGNANMINMPELSTEIILDNLRARFVAEDVYTYIGDIVVSVNPFKHTGNSGMDIMQGYVKEAKTLPLHTPSVLQPHVYALVGKTHKRMCEVSCSQSVLISGESGAGKTEAMKLAIAHLGVVTQSSSGSAGGTDDVARQVMATNPVMEPIGNAKTTRNNNSSRFGKHIDIQFDEGARIIGARTTSYLLEKPRICKHMPGERNYHILYMLCVASAEIRKAGQLEADYRHYAILDQEGTIAQVQTWNDSEAAQEMDDALAALGFGAPRRQVIYTLFGLVLQLGNLQFVSQDSAGGVSLGSRVSNQAQLELAASMMRVTPAQLQKAVCTKSISAGKDGPIEKGLDAKQADSIRNSLCMHLYSLVFDWVVHLVNEVLSASSSHLAIGVLDIFGFENFTLNSFPQARARSQRRAHSCLRTRPCAYGHMPLARPDASPSLLAISSSAHLCINLTNEPKPRPDPDPNPDSCAST